MVGIQVAFSGLKLLKWISKTCGFNRMAQIATQQTKKLKFWKRNLKGEFSRAATMWIGHQDHAIWRHLTSFFGVYWKERFIPIPKNNSWNTRFDASLMKLSRYYAKMLSKISSKRPTSAIMTRTFIGYCFLYITNMFTLFIKIKTSDFIQMSYSLFSNLKIGAQKIYQ